MNDQELMREFIARGSDTAFQTLVRRHLPLVYGAAFRRLGETGWAEEVTQNVFIALARKARFLGCEAPLASWLHRTAILESRHRLRFELRRKRREETAAALGRTMQDDDSAMRALIPLLDEGLAQLGEQQRQILILRYLEGRTFRALAETLGIQEDAAQKRAAKALDCLAAWFRKRGYAVSTGTIAAGLAKSGASSAAAPIALAAAITQAALSQAPGLPAGILGALLGRVLSLPRARMAVVCAFLAAGPILVEWNSARAAGRRVEEIRAGVSSAEQFLAQLREDAAAASNRRQRLESSVRRGEMEAAYREAIDEARGPNSGGLYFWQEGSEYVRLPKSIFEAVVPREMEESSTVGGYRETGDLLAQDGTPSNATLKALGLSEEQRALTGEFCRKFLADYAAAARARSYFVEQLPPEIRELNLPKYDRVRIRPALAPEESARLQEFYTNGLARIMGAERAQVFHRLDPEIYERRLDNFGALTRLEALRLTPGAPNVQKHQEFATLRMHLNPGGDEGTRPHWGELPGHRIDDTNFMAEFLAGPPLKD